MKSIPAIVDLCVKAYEVGGERNVERVVNNEIPTETCAEKKLIASRRREKVVEGLPEPLKSTVGPKIFK